MQSQNFDNVERLNFERTPEIYMSLKNSLIEQRIKLLKIDILEKEMLLVERNNQSGKFTHPRTDDGHGDGCDALAGSLYNAIKNEDKYISSLSTIKFVSDNEDLYDKLNILKVAAGHYEIENENKMENKSNKRNMSSWIL